VCCSVLQRVAVCCGVLQCVAVCCSVLRCVALSTSTQHSTLLVLTKSETQIPRYKYKSHRISIRIRIARCRRIWVSRFGGVQGFRIFSGNCHSISWMCAMAHSYVWRESNYLHACCSVLQCVAVCCSVLQCVAACCSVIWIQFPVRVTSTQSPWI